ncbi:MAG: hypothetical protein K2Y42_20490 [Hyphomicrobium sp.]|jgi:hypothetical protein|uniref:hypothetical protein n=1 Tax=Hyphomicrobium sp. TaxID=82 RepID=UPI0025BF8DDE|nr:hypothetical protein [Hyphomicrobium sp.]MBX9865128.1 hypothetical protein [Hyphomicrobium sp.]
MTQFNLVHAALFDELIERQGVHGVDIARLTQAVLTATEIIEANAPHGPYLRCANGGCDE